MSAPIVQNDFAWPALPLRQWRDTYATVHMWTQIVGKIPLALAPLFNHWWNVPLYVCARGKWDRKSLERSAEATLHTTA